MPSDSLTFVTAWASVGTDLTCFDGSTGLTLVPPNGKVRCGYGVKTHNNFLALPQVLYSCGGKMLAFDQVTNQWSPDGQRGAMSNYGQANFVQTGSVSYIIGNVEWDANGKETIVRYEPSESPKYSEYTGLTLPYDDILQPEGVLVSYDFMQCN